MSLKVKDLLIAALIVIIAWQFFLLCRTTRVSASVEKIIDRVPDRIPVDVYVIGLAEAVEKQNRICSELNIQNRWLFRHLEKCVTLLETERNLEPISIHFDNSKDPMLGMILMFDKQGPFVIPCPKYNPQTSEPSEDEKTLQYLATITHLTNNTAQTTLSGADSLIDNFHQRLQRLDPNRCDPNSRSE